MAGDLGRSEDRVLIRFGLTEPERKAVIMALRARMRTEAGTFHELLRRAVERMEAPDAETPSRGQSDR